MKTRIVIPTYNEHENINRLIQEILAIMPAETQILVIDDNSPDGTAELVRGIAASESRVRLMMRPKKLGLSSAYQTAFDTILAEGGDEVIVTMDADLSHQPQSLPALVSACRDHDLAVGSRYIPGGEIENWELWRRLLSWGGNRYVRFITGLPTRDCTAGFSATRTDFLRRVPYREVKASGYAWWFALRMMFYRRGARIIEVPITFTDRRLGKSKISTHIIYEGLIEPWRVRWSVH